MSPQRLGQNFLADEGWRSRIAEAVLPSSPGKSSGGVWVEIGAGHGEMTEYLAQTADRVVAIELDDLLLPGLAERTAAFGNVTVVPGNVLELDLAQLAAAAGAAPHFHVYGNLPYYITSPIVHRLLESQGLVDAFLVVQLEVAERMAAPPGSRDRGYLSAFVEFHARAEIVMRIPPGAFRPRPKVTSALIALRPPGKRAELGVTDEAAFVDLLKACFAQKRKTLRNNLRAAGASGAENALERAGIRSSARAEEITLADFAHLFAALNSR